MHLCSVRRGLAMGRSAGDICYALWKKRREKLLRHVSQSLPDLPPEEVERLARKSVESFMQLAVELMFTTRVMNRDSWQQHVTHGDLTEAIGLIESDRPTIMLTGHMGNWEILGYAMTMRGLDYTALARPFDNPHVSRWLFGERQKRGMKIISKFGATQDMVQVMERGGTLGFIADQNAGVKGMFVPFFGRLASTYKSIGLLAIQYEAPIVCGYARRAGDFQFEVIVDDIIYPDDWKAQPDPLFYVTARYVRALETMVRRDPEQYLWLHRRWKSRPKFELNGKPLPEAMRKKLLQLPWMNEAQVARIAESCTWGPG